MSSKKFHLLRNALFVVSDDTILERLASAQEFAEFDPMIVPDPAYAFIDNEIRYGTIYIGSNISTVPLLNLLKKARHLYPMTGIYLIGPPSFSNAEVKGMGLQGVLPFPAKLTDLPIPPLLSSEVLHEARGTPEKKAQVRDPERTPEEEKKFAPIPIEDFFSGERIPFDVYLRLSEGHYVKIISAGSFFERSRVIKFVGDGIGTLYVERLPLLKCLSFYDYLMANLMALPGITMETKMCHLAATARTLEDVANVKQLSPERVNSAMSVLKDLYSFVKNEEKAIPKVVQLFLGQTDIFTHGSAVAFACAILARPLKLESDRPKQLLGQAALFHDIGMASLPKELQTDDESVWSDAAKAKYPGHAKLGAELLSEARFDAAVVQAVLQHHERRNRHSSVSLAISPLAEIVGIADELVNEITRKDGVGSQDQRISALEARAVGAFSPEVVDAFKICFGSQRKK